MSSVCPKCGGEKFWNRVEKRQANECWLWIGPQNGLGYGKFRVPGNRHYAHRFSYELKNGPIPAGLFVLHHCDNPACVNPEHLFLGTQRDNIRDAMSKGRKYTQPRATHCKRGHAFTPENTWRGMKDGRAYQRCRECNNSMRRKSWLK